jgi:hypothetical protein
VFRGFVNKGDIEEAEVFDAREVELVDRGVTEDEDVR